MPSRDVTFPPKDQPLRDDVGQLGDLVGEMLREQGGEALFSRVEASRKAAIRRREGDPQASETLRHTLSLLSAGEATEVVRAFSAYFQVVNLAERVHRIRRGRSWMRSTEGSQPGSLTDTVRRLQDLGLDRSQAHALFAKARVEPVFTAHPTESTRRIVLEKQERIALELLSRLNPERTPREERVAWARIRENVTTTWQTEEHPSTRPTVADEREHVLYYVSHVLYRVLPALQEALGDALDEVFGPESRGETVDTPPLVRPGSWVGGDMDGNPNVDASTIRETLHRHRDLALQSYTREVATLRHHLTQSQGRIEWSPQVTTCIERYGAWFPDVLAAVPARHRSMGYGIMLELIAARLRQTASGDAHGYEGPAGFERDLMVIADSLIANRGEHAGLFGVRRLLQRVRAFGFHLAALDVRQDARALRDVVGQLRKDSQWLQRSPERRAETLRGELLSSDFRSIRARFAPAPETPRGTLDVFRAVAEARATYGPDAIGYYIISMARDVDDVLTVLWLAALASTDPPSALSLDVAPLFETVPDLERAEGVLDRMFTDPVLAPHLHRRGGRQLVMVGYSDSNKDGGVFSARWALQQALERMARAADRHHVTLTVFHGRGGTVSRGGGSVHRAVAAMPARSIGGRLRLTEQGEVIDAKYGLPHIALRELERMLGSIALRTADPGQETPREWQDMAETMTATARATYRALVYEHPRFKDYFRASTPIDVIERMSIGSRPPSRRSGSGVEDLRAIPWVFAWTQCRAMMTGWYGLGTALDAAREQHGASMLREAAEGWPFFGALLADVEMVLAKADLEIAGLYRPLAPEGAATIFDEIQSEFHRTVTGVLDVRGADTLLAGDPTLRRSIRLRNPYVDPMNILQVDLLSRWREDGRPDGPLMDALLATVNGIARGLQNTG